MFAEMKTIGGGGGKREKTRNGLKLAINLCISRPVSNNLYLFICHQLAKRSLSKHSTLIHSQMLLLLRLVRDVSWLPNIDATKQKFIDSKPCYVS